MKPVSQIKKENGVSTLYVDNAPFIALGGQLHNSSSSSAEWLDKKVWPFLKPVNLNSVIATVSWEQIEPSQGVFDFSVLDHLIASAQENGVKLTLIWFGLWKNGQSTFVPEWVKLDRQKYWVCQCPDTSRLSSYYHEMPAKTISPFCKAAVEADATAFSALMRHIKQVDKLGTVILIQVENEIGLLGAVRDFSPPATELFNSAIPTQLADAIGKNGSWAEVFGRNASESFMAWNYGIAVEKIASAGKGQYNLPMYVNAWLEQYPNCAGVYPSGGPVAKMMDIWKVAAPSIDFYAPDIYVPDFEKVIAEYSKNENPLFIPETASSVDSAARVFLALCEYNAIGFNPFGIEDLFGKGRGISEEELAALNINSSAFCNEGTAAFLPASYKLLSSIMHLILPARGTGRLRGFYNGSLDNGTVLEFSQYEAQVIFQKPESGKPKAGGGILEVGPNEFYVFGTNFKVLFAPGREECCHSHYLRIEEGIFENGEWKRGRILNGDEQRVEIPFEPTILRVKLYKY